MWHTTETPGLPNYSGSAPHFTLDPADGRLWQHIPLNQAARALKPGGPNFWNTVQVELIGWAKETHTWPDGRYARIAQLARWIEANFGVPRRTSVAFQGNGATPHLPSAEAFKAYVGHIGHQHVPGNDHWDPGKLKIDLILGGDDNGPAVRDLGRHDKGEDVKALQQLLVKRGYKILQPHVDGVYGRATEAFVAHFQWRHGLHVDGTVGQRTRAALGLGETPTSGHVERLELGLGEPLAEHAHVALGDADDI
ncbi:MAG: N-acetylmuramoyl-L-alanine amidase [Conexibacter sp.]